MATARDPIRKGKSNRRDWARLGIAGILHRFPRYVVSDALCQSRTCITDGRRGTSRIFRRYTNRDPGEKKPRPSGKSQDSYQSARDVTTQMDCLKLTSGEASNKTPVTSSPNDTFPSTQSKTHVEDNSLDIAPVRPFSRSQSRTFPQSNREKENGIMMSPSIDARLSEIREGSAEVENVVARHEVARRRRLQPVPNDFQDLRNHPKNKVYEKFAFDMQMKALEVAVRREQGGRQSLQDSKLFVDIWESKLLPEIEQVLDDNIKGEYTINVSRGPEPGKRTIVIMTAVLIADDVESQLRKSKSDILPSDLDSTTIIIFRQGRVEFLADPGTSLSRVSSRDSEDSIINPLNTGWSPDPSIGDSVGWEDESASLGPLLQIDRGFYRLVCWHLFDDRDTNRRWDNTQPPDGLSTFCPSLSDSKGLPPHCIGDVVTYSGPMYKTSRHSISINNSDVVTDWALIGSAEAQEVIPPRNIVRRGDTPAHIYDVEITQAKDPASFLRTCEDEELSPRVYSVGRTSGYTTGQLGLTHGRHRLPDGRKTKNWAVENVQPDEKEAVKQWIRAGMGVPGDSGAGVFGFWNNELLGQIWGRNTYDKNNTGPRFTFFTALTDICADIIEKMPGASTAGLPTCSSIRNSVHLDRDLASDDITWPRDDHLALPSISEERNNADFDDDHVDLDQEIKHRSAAGSRRLGAVMALGKKVNVFELSGCQPFSKWAKVIIHAATF